MITVKAVEVILLFSAFYAAITGLIYFLLDKYRIIEYIQLNGNFVLNNLASCHFCLCFWIGVILASVGIILGAPPESAFSPVLVAPLTRLIP